MKRRRNKWIRYRRSRADRSVRFRRSLTVESDTVIEPSERSLELEAVRLLHAWSERQDAIGEMREGSGARAEQKHDAALVPFAWEDAPPNRDALAVTRRLRTDGVRERLRGRGEI